MPAKPLMYTRSDDAHIQISQMLDNQDFLLLVLMVNSEKKKQLIS